MQISKNGNCSIKLDVNFIEANYSFKNIQVFGVTQDTLSLQTYLFHLLFSPNHWSQIYEFHFSNNNSCIVNIHSLYVIMGIKSYVEFSIFNDSFMFHKTVSKFSYVHSYIALKYVSIQLERHYM